MNNANFALVVAEPLKDAHGLPDKEKWKNFLLNVENHMQLNAAIQTIHENIWQISLDTGLPILGNILRWQSVGASIRIAFLQDEPIWLVYPPPTPKATA